MAQNVPSPPTKKKSKTSSPGTPSSGTSSGSHSEILSAIQRLEARLSEIESRPNTDPAKITALEEELAAMKQKLNGPPTPASSNPEPDAPQQPAYNPWNPRTWG